MRSRNKAMDLFISPNKNDSNDNKLTVPAVPTFQNPFKQDSLIPHTTITVPTEIPETADNVNIDSLIDDADGKIALAKAHNSALEVLNTAVEHLKLKMDDIKPDKLPSVISAASKVVEGIRKERNEAARAKGNRSVHMHFYTPVQRKIEEYDVVEVG